MRFVRKILRDEEGASVIMVAVAIVMVFGFAVVAIDMSLIQLAKTQLQNAADAGALAGATAMALTSGSQADKEAAATAEAIRVCSLNVALQEIDRSVAITPDKVTFPQPNLVRVTTGTGDYVTTYFLKVLDPLLTNQEEITATAMAGIETICGTNCLRPFSPPDRWEDVDSNGIWTPGDEYDDLNASGVWDAGEPLTNDWNENGVWDPAEFYDPEITGYRAPDDVGFQVTLKYNSPGNTDWETGWFYPVRFAPINTGDPLDPGGANYQRWIEGDTCEPYIVSIGDSLALESGNMVGPTTHGLDYLIAKDPTAQWDDGTGTVLNSAFATSPRVVKVAAFDPTRGIQTGPPRHVVVSKIMVLFIEWWFMETGERYVVGRFMQTITEGVPGDCSGSMMLAVVLVE
jgi:Flp pilus assembly protein TadG